MKTNLFEIPVRDQWLFGRESIKLITAAIVRAFPGTTVSRKGDSLFIKTQEIHDNAEIWQAVGVDFSAGVLRGLQVETFKPVRTGGSAVTHVGMFVNAIAIGLYCGSTWKAYGVVPGSLAESYAKGEICRRCLAKVRAA